MPDRRIAVGQWLASARPVALASELRRGESGALWAALARGHACSKVVPECAKGVRFVRPPARTVLSEVVEFRRRWHVKVAKIAAGAIAPD
eukprot:scaffold44612_cov58-Phaeocystis_antarctica.AAC.3